MAFGRGLGAEHTIGEHGHQLGKHSDRKGFGGGAPDRETWRLGRRPAVESLIGKYDHWKPVIRKGPGAELLIRKRGDQKGVWVHRPRVSKVFG